MPQGVWRGRSRRAMNPRADPQRAPERARSPTRAVTFVVGGDPVRRALGPAPRGGLRLRPPTSRRSGCAPATMWASSARPPGRSSPPSRPSGWPAAPSWSSPCPCACPRSRSSSTQTRARIANADVALVVVDPIWPRSSNRAAGRPADGRLLGDLAAPATAGDGVARVDDPDRSPSCSSPAAPRRTQGRHAPAPTRCWPNIDAMAQRRHARPRRRRARLLAAALPRHGPHRSARRRPMTTGTDLVLGRARRTSSPPRPLDGVDQRLPAARSPPGPTSPTPWRRGRCGRWRRPRPLAAGASRSTAPSPSTRRPSTAFVEAGARRARPGAVFPAFGMAEVALAGTFPDPCRACAVDAVDRPVLEAERYAAPVPAAHERARRLAMLGRPVPGPRDPHRRPRDRRPCGRPRGRRARDPRHVA